MSKERVEMARRCCLHCLNSPTDYPILFSYICYKASRTDDFINLREFWEHDNEFDMYKNMVFSIWWRAWPRMSPEEIIDRLEIRRKLMLDGFAAQAQAQAAKATSGLAKKLAGLTEDQLTLILGALKGKEETDGRTEL